MTLIEPKKSLGQHFLTDHNIARKITNSINFNKSDHYVEIGPGTGILTAYLHEKAVHHLWLVEYDKACADYLKEHYPALSGNIIQEDILKLDFRKYFQGSFSLIGNLPYNISSQIFFRVYDHRDAIKESVFMIQKEVAERIKSGPGNKNYGILSVLLQTFFNIEYLFTVNEQVFYPRPRVKSAVIRLQRNETHELDCDEALFVRIIKKAFNQRRKTLRNSLKEIITRHHVQTGDDIFNKRPEQLSTEDFRRLTRLLS